MAKSGLPKVHRYSMHFKATAGRDYANKMQNVA